jgi:predicted ribosome quality control (RQC) complex YloA/Tae2 family protein
MLSLVIAPPIPITLQPIDETVLKAFATQSEALMQGAKCQKITQLTAYDFLFSFWKPNPQRCPILMAHQHLYISLRKDAPFICWIDEADVKALESLHGKGRTTPLGAVLKKYLLGAKLEAMAGVSGEPLLQLNFTTTTDLGFRLPVTLTLELMGRFTNLILMEKSTQKIVGLFNVVTDTMSRLRQLRAGGLYALPPTPANKPLLETLVQPSAHNQACLEALKKAKTPAQWMSTIQAHYFGCAKPLLKAIAEKSTSAEDFLALLEHWVACPVSEKQFLLLQQGDHQRFVAFPTAWIESEKQAQEKLLVFETATGVLKTVYFKHLQQQRFTQVHKQFAKPLNQALEQLNQQLAIYQNAEALQAQAKQYQTQADWLMTLLSMGALAGTHPPAGSLQLENPFDETGEMPFLLFEDLHPTKTWKQNSHWLYKQVQKLNSRLTYYASQVVLLETRLHHLETLNVHLQGIETVADFDYLRPDWEVAGLMASVDHQAKIASSKKKQKVQKIAKKPEKPAGILTVSDPHSGVEVWVGKSSQANGYLAGKALRADDWWFHAGEGIAGSHVVVRCSGTSFGGGNQPLPNETITFVAGLAAYYSGARESAKVPVIYTLGKFVRPIPQSYPGHVSHSHETSVLIPPQKEG